ncbi:J domain-containing protein [Geminocystis sp. CENA526]|uniref:J domain-containing protein n=1 Tax=Geminocystis sp. CENA526 TaxID=1355871 RepID=UPI003D6EDCAE
MDNLTLEQCYQILNLTEQPTLEELDHHYYKLIGEKLKSGNKDEINNLKLAYSQLREYCQNKQDNQVEKETKKYQHSLTNSLNQDLKNIGMRVKVQSFPNHLEVIIKNVKISKKLLTTKLIYDSLNHILKDTEQDVIISSIGTKNNLIWQEKIKICTGIYAHNAGKYNTEILLKEAEIKTNTYGLPIAFLIAFAINFIEPLAWFISMWVHEFGHATVAWFSGYRAMVTFAGTIISFDRSLFVYFGILILIGLTFYSGWKEQKKTTMIVCIILAIMQFILTWKTSYSTYRMLLYFGGIGGEFYLSTLLIIAFYWRLPEKFYWEFWRIFALVIGATTFWGNFTKWHRISKGKADIPWGTFWGGRGDSGGDLNVLNNEVGWSANQIINTYNTLGFICFLVIIGTYLYFLWKSNPVFRLQISRYFS